MCPLRALLLLVLALISLGICTEKQILKHFRFLEKFSEKPHTFKLVKRTHNWWQDRDFSLWALRKSARTYAVLFLLALHFAIFGLSVFNAQSDVLKMGENTSPELPPGHPNIDEGSSGGCPYLRSTGKGLIL